MKFGTVLDHTLIKVFGYRAIADLLGDTIFRLFSKWPPSTINRETVNIFLCQCPKIVEMVAC